MNYKLCLCFLMFVAYARAQDTVWVKPGDPRLPSQHRVDRRQRDLDRENEAEWRQERREAILSARKRARTVRDKARRRGNLIAGFSPSIDMMTFEGIFPGEVEENAPSLGLSLGYRRHFLQMLGFRIGTQVHVGETHATYSRHDSYNYYDMESEGFGGATYTINNNLQAIFGPFGRFTLEPGVGATWGGHTRDTLTLSGPAGDYRYPLARHLAFVNGILGASFYFGSQDRFNASFAFVFGKNMYRKGEYQNQINLGFTYAIDLDKPRS